MSSMSPPIHLRTTVQPGHRIEVQCPELPEGRAASVFIVLEEAATKRPVFEVLGDYPGGQLFQTAQEVDQYLKSERESWDK